MTVRDMTTIAAGYPKALLDFAVAKGADRKALLDRAGLEAAALDDPDNRVALSAYTALMEAGIAQLHEPALALQFGEAVRMQEISIVGLICEAAATTMEVGRQLNRYSRLMLDSGGAADLVRGVPGPEGLWMEVVSAAYARDRWMVEAELARLVCNTRAMFAGNPAFEAMVFPREVHFLHAAPDHAHEYERIFRAPIVFGSNRAALLLDPTFVLLQQPPTNRYVFGVLSARADALLKELEASNSVRARVESVLLPILHTGDAAMDNVAAAMGLSRRSLQRKLAAEGTTFEKVLDALRRRMALDYLNGRKASVNEIAYLVGFSEAASFSRAFKRWTGTTPRALRGK
jgi:AraC-like DNA-binding protein